MGPWVSNDTIVSWRMRFDECVDAAELGERQPDGQEDREHEGNAEGCSEGWSVKQTGEATADDAPMTAAIVQAADARGPSH